MPSGKRSRSPTPSPTTSRSRSTTSSKSSSSKGKAILSREDEFSLLTDAATRTVENGNTNNNHNNNTNNTKTQRQEEETRTTMQVAHTTNGGAASASATTTTAQASPTTTATNAAKSNSKKRKKTRTNRNKKKRGIPNNNSTEDNEDSDAMVLELDDSNASNANAKAKAEDDDDSQSQSQSDPEEPPKKRAAILKKTNTKTSLSSPPTKQSKQVRVTTPNRSTTTPTIATNNGGDTTMQETPKKKVATTTQKQRTPPPSLLALTTTTATTATTNTSTTKKKEMSLPPPTTSLQRTQSTPLEVELQHQVVANGKADLQNQPWPYTQAPPDHLLRFAPQQQQQPEPGYNENDNNNQDDNQDDILIVEEDIHVEIRRQQQRQPFNPSYWTVRDLHNLMLVMCWTFVAFVVGRTALQKLHIVSPTTTTAATTTTSTTTTPLSSNVPYQCVRNNVHAAVKYQGICADLDPTTFADCPKHALCWGGTIHDCRFGGKSISLKPEDSPDFYELLLVTATTTRTGGANARRRRGGGAAATTNNKMCHLTAAVQSSFREWVSLVEHWTLAHDCRHLGQGGVIGVNVNVNEPIVVSPPLSKNAKDPPQAAWMDPSQNPKQPLFVVSDLMEYLALSHDTDERPFNISDLQDTIQFLQIANAEFSRLTITTMPDVTQPNPWLGGRAKGGRQTVPAGTPLVGMNNNNNNNNNNAGRSTVYRTVKAWIPLSVQCAYYGIPRGSATTSTTSATTTGSKEMVPVETKNIGKPSKSDTVEDQQHATKNEQQQQQPLLLDLKLDGTTKTDEFTKLHEKDATTTMDDSDAKTKKKKHDAALMHEIDSKIEEKRKKSSRGDKPEKSTTKTSSASATDPSTTRQPLRFISNLIGKPFNQEGSASNDTATGPSTAKSASANMLLYSYTIGLVVLFFLRYKQQQSDNRRAWAPEVAQLREMAVERIAQATNGGWIVTHLRDSVVATAAGEHHSQLRHLQRDIWPLVVQQLQNDSRLIHSTRISTTSGRAQAIVALQNSSSLANGESSPQQPGHDNKARQKGRKKKVTIQESLVVLLLPFLTGRAHAIHHPKLVRPSANDVQYYTVTDWGVVGDGKHDDTDAMRRLLSKCFCIQSNNSIKTNDNSCPCHKHIVIPDGAIVMTLPLNLTSHTTLQVDGILRAIPTTSHWPIMPPNPIYGDSEDRGPGGGWLINQYQSFLYAQDATHIRITGDGLIDGNGPYWWDLFTQNNLTQAGRPNLVQTVNSSIIELDSVTLKDAGFWTVHPMTSTDIYIHLITIRSPMYAPNVDGIDPDSCRNVIIEYNDVACGDDHIAIKAGVCGTNTSSYVNKCEDQNWQDRAHHYTTSNITIRHNIFRTGMGIAIGSETSGSVTDVFIYNNTIGLCESGSDDKYKSCGWGPALHLKTTITRSGMIDNIVFDANTIYNNTMFILLETNYQTSQQALPVNYPKTRVSNIQFTNNRALGGAIGAQFHCDPNDPCHNITVVNNTIVKAQEQKLDPWSCQFVESYHIADNLPMGLEDCMAHSMNHSLIVETTTSSNIPHSALLPAAEEDQAKTF